MKLNPISIYIIGIAVALMALSYGVFYNFMPNSAQAQYFNDATEQLNTEAAKMPQAKKKVENAQREIADLAKSWAAVTSQHTPTNNLGTQGINLNVNAYQLTEDTRKYRNSVQRAVNAQVRRGGVTVVNGPLVPFADSSQPGQLLATYYNYASAGYPVVIFNLGTVTVQGTYEQIMNHVRSYASMPRYLAVTDGLTLDGTSPNLTATYNLTVVGYIPASTVFGGLPASATTASTTPGGMPGMPGGGMPGMPGRPGMPGAPMGGPGGGPGMPGAASK